MRPEHTFRAHFFRPDSTVLEQARSAARYRMCQIIDILFLIRMSDRCSPRLISD
jgi:hypothetical protein